MKSHLHKFLRYLQIEKGFSQGTIDAYRLDIDKSLIRFLYQRGICEVEEVTRDDIRDYLEYQATVKGNANVTRARKLAAIRSFFNYLVAYEGLEVNPAALIMSPKLPEKEPEYLTEQESTRLLATITKTAKPKVGQRDIAIIIILFHTGMRVSELVKLELVNVDLEKAQIKINRKGNKEQYLHLNGETVYVLEAYLARRPKTVNSRFFVGIRGGNLDRIYIYNMIRRYLHLAGIVKNKHGPHLLRHTFCTRLHQKGIDPFTIKDLAGHKSLNTTMKYIKIENKEQAMAIDQLEFKIF